MRWGGGTRRLGPHERVGRSISIDSQFKHNQRKERCKEGVEKSACEHQEGAKAQSLARPKGPFMDRSRFHKDKVSKLGPFSLTEKKKESH